MTIEQIYQEAATFIGDILRAEVVAQGHHLSGALEQSIGGQITVTDKAATLEGFALFYSQYVDKGFPATSASFKQAPFLIRYFEARGLAPEEARGAAFATIRTWMKTGMPTPASRAFSNTGARTGYVEAAFVGHSSEIDTFILGRIDEEIERLFQATGSGTI